MACAMDVADFIKVHEVLLLATGLPRSLYEPLFNKIASDTFDAGSNFRVEPVDGGRERRVVLSADKMAKESDVFLVDHAWSFRLPDARTQLLEVRGLAERMAALMCVVGEEEGDVEASEDGSEAAGRELEEGQAEALLSGKEAEAKERGTAVQWLELDDLCLDDASLENLNLSSRCPGLVGLSLWGNKLESLESVVRCISGLTSLRALWLNENPLVKVSGNKERSAVLAALPHLEIYNSAFTPAYTLWAISFAADVYGPQSPEIPSDACQLSFPQIVDLDLSGRGLVVLKPEVFNSDKLPAVSSINICGNALEENDALEILGIFAQMHSIRSLKVDLPGPLGESASYIAEKLPRLERINGVDIDLVLERGSAVAEADLEPRLPEWSPEEHLAERVMRAMWRYVMHYRLATEEKLDETPVWYVMDEFGSAIRHSDDPNFMVAPFMFLPDGTLQSAISYSLVWPVKEVRKDEECTRDFLRGVSEDRLRSARLTAWFKTPRDIFKQAYEQHKTKLLQVKCPTLASNGTAHIRPIPSRSGPFLVYSDIPQVLDYLNRPEFKFVEEASEADIVWTYTQIDDEFRIAAGLRREQFVNQFPGEACLVMKHFLAQTVHQAYGLPDWLQPTYELDSQLPALIGDYEGREDREENNLWILKPWNMARSIDATVTDSLPSIIRLMETGPKICQKYIDKPTLFQGRKFDLRYVVMVRSMEPLELFVGNLFWGRFAIHQYTTDTTSLSDYETHFTVMNYRGPPLAHTYTHDFVPAFEKEHGVSWDEIDLRVKKMLRQLFEAGAAIHPEMHDPNARALYGVDVMIDHNFHPKLLEVTYCPDCTRACKYDMNDIRTGEVIPAKDFFNNVFGCLFLDEASHVTRL